MTSRRTTLLVALLLVTPWASSAAAQDVVGAEPTIEGGSPEEETLDEERPLPVPKPLRKVVEKTVAAIDAKVAVSSLQVGMNLRTDLGTHPVRLDAGIRMADFDFLVVVDPMVLVDGQFDLDVLAAWRPFGAPWSAMVGWRTTAIELATGSQYQQRLLLGTTADLPSVLDSIGATWGLELATVLVRHGGGLPSESIAFTSGRHFIDYINFGMFLRIHFTTPLGDEG